MNMENRQDLAYQKEMREWTDPDASLVGYFQRDDVADVGIFRRPDGTYDVIRAFPLQGEVQVSVDKNEDTPNFDALYVEHIKNEQGVRA